jgi:hypothetical protein
MVILADAGLPVPPPTEVTELVVFVCRPAPMPVTLRENVHVPLELSVKPDILTLPLPAVAVTVPQGVLEPLGVDTARPAGRLSVKPMPVTEPLTFILATVKLRVVDPPTAMEPAPKHVTRLGGEETVRVAVTGTAAPLWSEVPVLVLTIEPGAVACISKPSEQEVLAGSVNPERNSVVPETPEFGAMHVTGKTGPSKTRPAGTLVLRPTPVRGKAFGLVNVTVKTVVPVPPTGTDDGLKAAVITGWVAGTPRGKAPAIGPTVEELLTMPP